MSILNNKAFQFGLLAATGAAWGMTNPLAKISVSSGYGPLGVMFWQLVIVAIFSGGSLVLRKRRLPLHRKAFVLYAVIALVGTMVPDYLIYTSAVHIPAGILSIIMAISPMLALPMALMMRIETFSVQRMSGAMLGLVAVVLMVGPKDALASSTEVVFSLVVLCAAGLYAIQGNFIIWYGQSDFGAMRMLFGSTILALFLVTPLVFTTGPFIDPRGEWTTVEWAILGTGVLHAFAYAGFLALISLAGPVFASQVSYIVTGTGVLWSILLLSEGYSGWVWISFVMVMVAIVLVQPRRAPATPGDPTP